MIGWIIIFVVLAIIYGFYYDNKKQNTISIDGRGYERDGYGKLVHRKVAYEYLYDWKKYSERFGFYDIHHIDKNKRNNSPDNLQILTREEHKAKHGR